MLRIVIKPHQDPGTVTPQGGGDQEAKTPKLPEGEEQKVPNELAGYMGPENGPFECEHCMHFSMPNQCNILTNPVDPEGCCNLFEPDPNKREEPDGSPNDKELEEDEDEGEAQ